MRPLLPAAAAFRPGRQARWRGQRLPSGDGPGTGAGLSGVGHSGEQPAQLDRSRELAALLVDGADRGGLCLGDDEHAGRMGVRTEGDKGAVPRWVAELGVAEEPPNGPASGRRKRLQAAEAIAAAGAARSKRRSGKNSTPHADLGRQERHGPGAPGEGPFGHPRLHAGR